MAKKWISKTESTVIVDERPVLTSEPDSPNVKVKMFHPDGFSVNTRCLDPAGVTEIRIVRQFDGADDANWEAHVSLLPPLSD